MKFESYEGFTGRLMHLYDSLADNGYSSHADENIVTVYDEDDQEIAEFEIEFTGGDGSDEIIVTGITE